MFLVSEPEKNIEKINAREWTLIVDGIRDYVWAKIKNGKVHVLSSFYDEDGFLSRNIFIGNTYEEAVASKEVLSHWETFEPYYLDDEDDDYGLVE